MWLLWQQVVTCPLQGVVVSDEEIHEELRKTYLQPEGAEQGDNEDAVVDIPMPGNLTASDPPAWSSPVIKGVVHPQNDFLSIDYSYPGHLSSIVFFCICRIRKIEKWF